MTDAANVLDEMAARLEHIEDEAHIADCFERGVAEGLRRAREALVAHAAELRAADVPPTGGLPKPGRVEVGQNWQWVSENPAERVVEPPDPDLGGDIVFDGGGRCSPEFMLIDPRWRYLGKSFT